MFYHPPIICNQNVFADFMMIMKYTKVACILREERESERAILADEAKDRFNNIIYGEGLVVPRIAVKVALEDIFKIEF